MTAARVDDAVLPPGRFLLKKGVRVMTVLSAEHRALMSELEQLVSEERNPNTMEIDLLPTSEVHCRRVRQRWASHLYGRRHQRTVGVLDAAECPSTFSVPADMVVGLIAGGADAFSKATEGAEDDAAAGVEALKDIALTRKDIVVGITVSGRTPYVVGGLTYAKALGATTVALCCNQDAALAPMADISILPVVGPEVLAGSTRLKSGTAQKLVLNMLSTASMIRSGKCYQNLMVDLKPTNMKLVGRAARIVTQATGCTTEQAQEVLRLTGNDVKLAILITVTGMPLKRARLALESAGGFLRKAIA
jgi:N-acetylmuramic acid 6-phosphate etherase